MKINENGKYIDRAEYYYNEHINMYCIVGTTYSAEDLETLESMFAAPDLLVEVPAPDYITADYDGAEW